MFHLFYLVWRGHFSRSKCWLWSVGFLSKNPFWIVSLTSWTAVMASTGKIRLTQSSISDDIFVCFVQRDLFCCIFPLLISWMQFLEFLERVQPANTGLHMPESKRPTDYAKHYPEPSADWPKNTATSSNTGENLVSCYTWYLKENYLFRRINIKNNNNSLTLSMCVFVCVCVCNKGMYSGFCDAYKSDRIVTKWPLPEWKTNWVVPAYD